MIILHHNDMDGRAAAALIRLYRNGNMRFVEMDYVKEVPFADIKQDECVYILDFSLQKSGDWEKLLSITNNIVWIDHHKTAIASDGIQHRLEGIRNVKACGAMLTWEWLHGDRNPPLALTLINDWDCWFHNLKDTIPFKMGMDMECMHPISPIWALLFFAASQVQNETINNIISRGTTVQKYQKQRDLEYIKSFGFETTIDGYSVFAINKGRTSSLTFGDLINQYDICVCFVFNGEQYTISLYSNKEDIECGQMCKMRGGGGHKGAAGFQSKELPEFLRKE